MEATIFGDTPFIKTDSSEEVVNVIIANLRLGFRSQRRPRAGGRGKQASADDADGSNERGR